jgi:hypothetical protein
VTHDMWLSLIGVLALAVVGAIVVVLYALHKDYKLEPKAAPAQKKAPAQKVSEQTALEPLRRQA